jgi:hypothetical protein
MAQVSVPQAIVLGAIARIVEGAPVPGHEVSGDCTVVLNAAEREQVLKVLCDFVRVPEFRSPAEWSEH